MNVLNSCQYTQRMQEMDHKLTRQILTFLSACPVKTQLELLAMALTACLEAVTVPVYENERYRYNYYCKLVHVIYIPICADVLNVHTHTHLGWEGWAATTYKMAI